MVKERVTVDFDSESYYLDGKYWESWDHYGEQMADSINKEFNKLSAENERLKKENEHIETCFKMADSTYHMLLKQYQNIEIALSKHRKENEQLRQELREVYDDDYYLKQFITAIINVYSKNNGLSPIRLEMIWDSSDMDKTSLKHLKSSFYE